MSSRQIVDDVRQGAQQAFDRTEATAAVAKLGVLDAIGRFSEVYRTLRAFGLDDVLGTIGLQRRRSPALAFGMFGVGLATGAVLGVMLAPSAGLETRRMLVKRAKDAFRTSEARIEQAAGTAKDAAKDLEAEAKRGGERIISRAAESLRSGDGPPNGRLRS